jgi:hypothetical protein
LKVRGPTLSGLKRCGYFLGTMCLSGFTWNPLDDSRERRVGSTNRAARGRARAAECQTGMKR